MGGIVIAYIYGDLKKNEIKSPFSPSKRRNSCKCRKDGDNEKRLLECITLINSVVYPPYLSNKHPRSCMDSISPTSGEKVKEEQKREKEQQTEGARLEEKQKRSEFYKYIYDEAAHTGSRFRPRTSGRQFEKNMLQRVYQVCITLHTYTFHDMFEVHVRLSL